MRGRASLSWRLIVRNRQFLCRGLMVEGVHGSQLVQPFLHFGHADHGSLQFENLWSTLLFRLVLLHGVVVSAGAHIKQSRLAQYRLLVELRLIPVKFREASLLLLLFDNFFGKKCSNFFR